MKRPSDIYTEDELRVIKSVMKMCTRDDLIFPQWEFSILTGVKICEAEEVIESWPEVDLADEGVLLTIRGILGNLIGYPHGRGDYLYSKTSLDAEDFRMLKERLDIIS